MLIRSRYYLTLICFFSSASLIWQDGDTSQITTKVTLKIRICLLPVGGMESARNPLNKYSTIRKRLDLQGVGPAYSFAKSNYK